MPRRARWPHAIIRELLALAERSGASAAKADSASSAELFRDAIYNFRKRENIGQEVEITLDGNRVVLTHKPAHAVSIVEPE